MGIEPTLPAWKAGALPLSYTRKPESQPCLIRRVNLTAEAPAKQHPYAVVEGVGFEPT